MRRSRKKGEQVFRSMSEFEKRYLPKSFGEAIAEKSTDPRALGISLAKESLAKIEKQLAEK